METLSMVNQHPTNRTLRKLIYGAPCHQVDEPLEYNGNVYVQMAPDDPLDTRVWEFSLTTGNVIQVSE